MAKNTLYLVISMLFFYTSAILIYYTKLTTDHKETNNLGLIHMNVNMKYSLLRENNINNNFLLPQRQSEGHARPTPDTHLHCLHWLRL